MKKSFLTFSLCAALGLFGTLNASEGHWGYGKDNGPKEWGKLGFHTCEVGKAQSPVNIVESQAKKIENSLKTMYKSGSKELVNNGHSVQLAFTDAGGIEFNGKKYTLVQGHAHTPSENWIENKPKDMEIHFVHQADDGELLVLGVLYEVGDKHEALDKIIQNAPKKVGDKVMVENVNPNDFLPKDKAYYAFTGSLTTPPCTENVQWIVLKNFPKFSKEQLTNFHAVLHDNAREPQPMNARELQIAE